MMTKTVPRKAAGFGATHRRDLWWVGPLSVFLGLSAFVVYTTFRIIYNTHYVVDTATSAYLLSPFYSPLIVWEGMPAWLSPGFLILWAPGGFRLTCYYYRKAYYRSFFLDPAACAVGESRRGKYTGETKGLYLLQNLHRYFLYLALLFILILGYDALLSFKWPNGFGMSIGSLVLLINVVLLSLYTFSCHSLRHLVGGKIDCYSCVAFGHQRHKLWKGVSKLNINHMLWAWLSLFMVAFADFYIWMVNIGMFTDLRIF